ncbi:MAG: hypothetical protein ACREGF_06210, partial [Candidatus Saccharimonadales bacterium]
MQILFNGVAPPCPLFDAAMRISIGGEWTSPLFGQFGVVDTTRILGAVRWYSAIAPLNSTVLRSSDGDLVLSATTSLVSPTHAGPVT